MSGMLFLGTRMLEELKDFYVSKVGMKVWLEQADCIVLKHGNILLGFCQRDNADTSGILTFLYEEKHEVEDMFAKLENISTTKPKENEKYRIYHFFASDPEGRRIEFQSFLHPVEPYMAGDDMLVRRRSIRHFKAEDIPDETLWKMFELCRYSPTSVNTESYYFIVIKDRKKLEFLASLRKSSSAPIARAPLAIAVITDPGKSKRHIQDGCIAAYHLILAAKTHGLGTCWIAAMDRDDVKEKLDIPADHYVATITPLGYPSEEPNLSDRRNAKEFVRFVE
jgi:nitroreductase